MRRRGVGLLLCLTAAAPLAGCGGSTTASPAASWGIAAKLADAGLSPNLLYGGPNPPRVRLEGLSDGTAFALWERTDPLTAVGVRFFNGVWEAPVEGAPDGRSRSWLAASSTGAATITWSQRAPGGGYLAWARRYSAGRGWLPPEQLQSQVSYPFVANSIGADPPEPGSDTAVVMSDAGAAQTLWIRGYYAGVNWGADVFSARLVGDAGWSPEEVTGPGGSARFFRVSRTSMVAIYYQSNNSSYPQVFESARGWLEPGRASSSPIFPLKIAAAKGGFAMTQNTGSELIVRGLAANGDMGPPETLISNYQTVNDGAVRHDICGNESGVFAFARSDTDSIIFKYRGASDTPPSFVTTTVIALGRPVTEPLACYLDRAGRALMVWRNGQGTLVNRYLPGTGFEGATSIGPAFATIPALAEDEKGNILATWAVLTADKRVEIWWNRLRNP